MDDRTVRVLLVDDDEQEYLLMLELLGERGKSQYELTWAKDFDQAVSLASANAFDVLLIDYVLGGNRNGLQLLETLLQKGIHAPMFLVTGQGSYEVDVQAMKAGAAGYLVKNELTSANLERDIRYAIYRAWTSKA